jgi:hypothetical protein
MLVEVSLKIRSNPILSPSRIALLLRRVFGSFWLPWAAVFVHVIASPFSPLAVVAASLCSGFLSCLWVLDLSTVVSWLALFRFTVKCVAR